MQLKKIALDEKIMLSFKKIMDVELEAKFLDIDKDKLRTTLKKIGATLVHAERAMKRRTFDYPDERLRKIGGWIRVRDEGDKTTLSYKQLANRSLRGTKEISVTVSDFETTCNLLLAVGLDEKSYQETKRERWDYDNAEITIDTWPWIPSFVEIEGKSKTQLKNIAQKLGLDWSRASHGSVEPAYQAVYDVTENEIDSWERITFCPVPDWLEIRRKPRK